LIGRNTAVTPATCDKGIVAESPAITLTTAPELNLISYCNPEFDVKETDFVPPAGIVMLADESLPDTMFSLTIIEAMPLFAATAGVVGLITTLPLESKFII
jgi:hypothetical protein